MKMSMVHRIEIRLTEENMRRTGIPDKCVVFFTRPPSTDMLIDAVYAKADLDAVPYPALDGIVSVIRHASSDCSDSFVRDRLGNNSFISNRLGIIKSSKELLFLPDSKVIKA